MDNTESSRGYGHPAARLYFDGDEAKYEQWEMKLLVYMKVRKLKGCIDPDSTTIHDADTKELAFAELVPFLDSRSLALIMRDAKNDGRKAMTILRNHYSGTGKQRVISLWNVPTTLQKQTNETLTDYIIRAETAGTCLKSADEVVSDSLLIAAVMKGLPPTYKPFTIFVTQSDKVMNFITFKTAIRNFWENERATLASAVGNVGSQMDGVMNIRHNNNKHRAGASSSKPQQQQQQDEIASIQCFVCNGEGHKSNVCPSEPKPQNSNIMIIMSLYFYLCQSCN